MSRKNKSLYNASPIYGHRSLLPDAKYNSILIHKMVNNLMLNGKKMIAQNAVYYALEKIASSNSDILESKHPSDIMTAVINAAKPSVVVRSKRVRGATYQVPLDLTTNDYRKSSAISIGIKWRRNAIRARKNNTLKEKVYLEFLAILKKDQSQALSKKDEVRRSAESNIAFSHLAN